MGAELIAVSYADPGDMASSFQRSINTSMPMEAVVEKLSQSIVAADLWVLHEINPQALLQRGGYAIGAARQILFFHPRLMVRLLAGDSAALLEVPLKFAALELSDGNVTVRWTDPAAAFARYGNALLSDLGTELAAVCETIAASLDSQSAKFT